MAVHHPFGTTEPDFRALFESAPGAFLVLSPGFRIVAASEAYLRITGTCRADILNRDVFEVFPDNPAELGATGVANLRASLERVRQLCLPDAMPVQRYDIRARGARFEARYWTPLNSPVLDADGTLRWIVHRVEDVTALVRSGRRDAASDVLARDQRMVIEQLRSANEAVRESEDRARMAIQAADIGVWDINPVTRSLRWSDRCKALFGLPQDAEVDYDVFFNALHAEDRERVRHTIRAALVPGHGGEFSTEYRAIGVLDGVERWIAAWGRAYFEDGQAVRFVGTVLDITERKNAEAERRRFAETLEQRVRQRTQELADLNANLQNQIAERERAEAALLQAHRLEAIGQLTGGIAHDFNNLLTAVVGNLEILEMEIPDSALRRNVEQAMKAALRGGTLTQQLLAFARKQHLSMQALDVNAIITGMRDLLQRTLGGLVRVDCALAPDLWPAMSDAAQLELVVLNLAINARDAMESGGTLRIHTRNAPAGCHVPGELPERDYVIISVIDEGTGMSPLILERALEPFFTTKDVGKGSGLGLAQVYGVARQSGGTIRLSSTEGQGTTVDVFLPRATGSGTPVNVQSAAGENDEDAPVFIDATILVADDDEVVRELAAGFLAKAGYRVRTAESGREALAVLEQESVALALIDYAMPGMTGAELARRARLVQPALAIIYVTGNAEAVADDVRVGQDPILNKPYSRVALLRLVRDVLDRQRAAPD